MTTYYDPYDEPPIYQSDEEHVQKTEYLYVGETDIYGVNPETGEVVKIIEGATLSFGADVPLTYEEILTEFSDIIDNAVDTIEDADSYGVEGAFASAPVSIRGYTTLL